MTKKYFFGIQLFLLFIFMNACSFITTTEMTPHFKNNQPFILASNQGVTDTIYPEEEAHQTFRNWLNTNDKWKRGNLRSDQDIHVSQMESSFILRYNTTENYVAVEGDFDKVSHGNTNIVYYYQEVEQGELDFLLESTN
ncbi:MAG: hypothetical protein MK212_07795 [Saprospiraceae bacterium]|nr:hypothetical protein [Saprospiraceae bacterium]